MWCHNQVGLCLRFKPGKTGGRAAAAKIVTPGCSECKCAPQGMATAPTQFISRVVCPCAPYTMCGRLHSGPWPRHRGVLGCRGCSDAMLHSSRIDVRLTARRNALRPPVAEAETDGQVFVVAAAPPTRKSLRVVSGSMPSPQLRSNQEHRPASPVLLLCLPRPSQSAAKLPSPVGTGRDRMTDSARIAWQLGPVPLQLGNGQLADVHRAAL